MCALVAPPHCLLPAPSSLPPGCAAAVVAAAAAAELAVHLSIHSFVRRPLAGSAAPSLSSLAVNVTVSVLRPLAYVVKCQYTYIYIHMYTYIIPT